MGLYRKATPAELARKELVESGILEAVNTSGLTPEFAQAVLTEITEASKAKSRLVDRHAPGYMAAYMRKRRAKAKP